MKEYTSFSNLIFPIDPTMFFEDIWENRVLHVARDDPQYFSWFGKDLSVEELIWQTCHSWGEVSLAGRGAALNDIDVTRPPNVPTIRRAFAAGATIVVNNVERKNAAVAWLCRAMEREWLFDTHVNLYVTGARLAGLGAHYDDEDVFILQVDGAKLWKVYDEPARLPLATEQYVDPAGDAGPCTEYELLPGDVLYVPRGFVHETRALDRTSVHLTLTVSVIRWLTLLQRMLTVSARQDVRLRRAIPLAALKNGMAGVPPVYAELLRLGGLGPGTAAVALAELREELLGSKPRLADPGVAVIAELPVQVGPDSVVSMASDQLCSLSATGEGSLLQCIAASVDISAELYPAIRFLCDGNRCSVADLPGELSVAEKVGLVRALASCGFADVVDGAASG